MSQNVTMNALWLMHDPRLNNLPMPERFGLLRLMARAQIEEGFVIDGSDLELSTYSGLHAAWQTSVLRERITSWFQRLPDGSLRCIFLMQLKLALQAGDDTAAITGRDPIPVAPPYVPSAHATALKDQLGEIIKGPARPQAPPTPRPTPAPMPLNPTLYDLSDTPPPAPKGPAGGTSGARDSDGPPSLILSSPQSARLSFLYSLKDNTNTDIMHSRGVEGSGGEEVTTATAVLDPEVEESALVEMTPAILAVLNRGRITKPKDAPKPRRERRTRALRNAKFGAPGSKELENATTVLEAYNKATKSAHCLQWAINNILFWLAHGETLETLLEGVKVYAKWAQGRGYTGRFVYTPANFFSPWEPRFNEPKFKTETNSNDPTAKNERYSTPDGRVRGEEDEYRAKLQTTAGRFTARR